MPPSQGKNFVHLATVVLISCLLTFGTLRIKTHLKSCHRALDPLRTQHGSVKSSEQRIGFFVTIANNSDYRGNGPMVQVHRLAQLSCSLDRVGSSMSRYVIMYGYNPAAVDIIKSYGWHVIDVSHFDMRPYYKPVFSLSESQDAKTPISQDYQQRKDGWASYYKFFLWNMTQFDKILHTDADVLMMENPDRWVEDADYPYGFLCDMEQFTRGWIGLNTHIMLVRLVASSLNNCLFACLRAHKQK